MCLEDAARTEDDFTAAQYHWDCRDPNRDRKERYYEVLRGEVPLDVGIAKNPHVFPAWLGTPVAQQMRSGNYLDWLANCPYEMHGLLADAVLSSLICSQKEDHKENFYHAAIQLLQSQEVARLIGQSTRNIRKKRNVILRKLSAGWYAHLRAMPAGSLSLEEKKFLRKYKKPPPMDSEAVRRCVMKKLFERVSSYWVRYDKYELRTDAQTMVPEALNISILSPQESCPLGTEIYFSSAPGK